MDLTVFLQEDFFSVDGRTVLPTSSAGSSRPASILGASRPRSSSDSLRIDSRPLARTLSRISLASALSTDTFLERGSDPTMPLRDLLDVIERHRSLQHARIVCAQSYQRFNGRVTHRFIILELEREGRQQIWLRIDRGRVESEGLLRFVRRGAIGDADDRVCYFVHLSEVCFP